MARREGRRDLSAVQRIRRIVEAAPGAATLLAGARLDAYRAKPPLRHQFENPAALVGLILDGSMGAFGTIGYVDDVTWAFLRRVADTLADVP